MDREVKSLKMSEKQLKRLMNVSMPMSEPDLHQVFAEAVISGRPDSGLKSELISGIRTLTIEEDSRVYVCTNLHLCFPYLASLGLLTCFTIKTPEPIH